MSKFFSNLLLLLLLCLGSVCAWALPMGYSGYKVSGKDPIYPTIDAACASEKGTIAWFKPVSFAYEGPTGKPDTWSCTAKDQGGAMTRYASVVRGGGICPENSTPDSGECICNTGFVEKGDKCVPPTSCKSGDTSSAGYYDTGKNTAGGPAVMICTGGCESIFDGSFPEGSALVDGEKHYYAKGEYIKTGHECTGSAETIGQGIPVAEIPPDSCGEGQVMGKVNGKNVCSKSGADGSPSTKPEDKKDQSSSTKTTTKDKDEEGNDRETTTTTKKNADGSTTTEKTVTVTKSNGNGGTTTTTTTSTSTTGGVSGSGGKGETGGKDDGKDDGDKEKGKCEKNSSDEGCGGAAANVDGKSLYNAKEKTFSDILSKASTDLKGSGIGSAFTGFFNVASGGACPVSNWHIPYINADLTFDFMCQSFALDAMLIIKGVLLVIASFMAFRIAFE